MGMNRFDGPVKVLHVAETAQGGVGSYIEEIVPVQVARYGMDAVRIVLPREHAMHFKRLPGKLLHTFDIASADRVRCMLRMAYRTWALVRQWQPDVVHVHSTYAGFVLRPLLALMPNRPRVVYCAHGWAFDRRASRWLNGIVATIERWWSAMSDAVVCISNHDRDSALGMGMSAQRLFVVCNGIGEQPGSESSGGQAHLWPAGRLRVLFVGRLDRQKGVDVLYEAMRQLGDRAAAVVVGAAVVAGDKAAQPPANVHFTGWMSRAQIGALYDVAQVVVVPSRWEGFGLVALEAMRSGCAVLATRVGGLPEVVDEGVTGALFAPDDSDALVHLLVSLTETRLAEMGAAGRRRFEALFHIDRVVNELDAVYREVLARQAHSTSQALHSGGHVADRS
jgi:glycosyltransferase involved in cell wall biosynthesis